MTETRDPGRSARRSRAVLVGVVVCLLLCAGVLGIASLRGGRTDQYGIGSSHRAVLQWELPPCSNSWFVHLDNGTSWQAIQPPPSELGDGPFEGDLRIVDVNAGVFTADRFTLEMFGGEGASFAMVCS